MTIAGQRMPSVQTIAFGVAGFLAPPTVEGYAAEQFPDLVASTAGRYAVRIGTVLASMFLTKQFVGQKEAFAVGFGGGLSVAISAVQDFMPDLLPAAAQPAVAGMGMYTDRAMLGEYTDRGLGAPPTWGSSRRFASNWSE